jgi:hypothetical protein
MPTLGFPAGSNPAVIGSAIRTPDSIVFEDDFTGLTNASSTVNAAKWYAAGVGTEVISTEATAESGGVILLQTGTSSADSCGIRGNGSFLPATQRQIVGVARLKLPSITAAAGFFGLAAPITNNNILSKIVAGTNTSDCIGFYIAAGGAISTVVGNGTTSVTTAIASLVTGISTPSAAADTYIELAFYVLEKTAVYFYANGIYVGKVTANIPTNVQAVTFDVQTATTAAKTLSVDYVNVSAGR